MSLRPDQNIQKILLSTTSRFNGEYETNDFLITHSWIRSPNSTIMATESAVSRSAFVLAFKTAPIVPEVGPILPEFHGTGNVLASLLSLLFGKRFDNNGVIESLGMYEVPDLSSFSTFCTHTLPHNSYSLRADYPVPLCLAELSRIAPILHGGNFEQKFCDTFLASVKFYWQALQVFERNPEIAYLHLITAGEILSNYFEYKKSELIDEQTRKILARISTDLKDGEKAVRHIEKMLLGIKRRFVLALRNLVDQEFFTRGEAVEFGRLKAETFEKAIGAAYDLRSSYVHSGVKFGHRVARCHAGMTNEMQIGRQLDPDPGLAKILEKAPTFVGLERIVRYCLLRFAENNQAYIAPSA